MELIGKRVYVENLGCAKNQVDAEVMMHALAQAGCVVSLTADDADVVLVNTCGFIEPARKESVDTFFTLRAQYPEAKVVMTGCLSQRYGKELDGNLPEANGIFGNRDLRRIVPFVKRLLQGERPVELPPYPSVSEEDDTRGQLFSYPGSAYLKISEGCNHRCRYCAIPLIRGSLRSRSKEAVLTEARRLIDSGIKELNLIAQDLGAYGTDWEGGGSRFTELLAALAALDGDFRIRMLYIHPDAFPPDLPGLVATSPKIIPYFDIPFQHASASVLRPMGRFGDKESYLSLIASIRKELPEATFRSTLLLGFTGENASTIEELKDFLTEARLDWVGSFIYSREEGTPAFKDRSARDCKRTANMAVSWRKEIEELQEPITQKRLLRFVGTELDVLIEEPVEGEDLAIGRTIHQAPEVDGLTVVMGRNLVPGRVIRCGITRVNGIDLEARSRLFRNSHRRRRPPMSRMEQYLQELNDPQREAVLENSAPLLVLAGAGSGKTRVITTKIAYAIDVLGYRPWEILAVTFTNKAANEMRVRVSRMLPEVDVSNMQIRTFHSFGAWLLRRYGSAIGLGNGFTIYDDEDSLALLATCFPANKKTELSPVAKAISLAKDMGLGPDSPELADFRRDKSFRRMFAVYEEKLHRVGNVDFADLIGRSIELLTGNDDVASYVHRRFRVILVDEYQDANISQFNLLKLLVGPESFICVVGDDDQSIYRFRGAEVKNILSFPDVYPGTKTIKLEQNYRSTGNILTVAGEIIAHNRERHPKALWTANDQGSVCHLLYVQDEKEEARRCAQIIQKSKNYDSTAILYRTNAQSAAFETLFKRLGIPYKVVGALRFYDREEVKDALALLYLLMNPFDVVNFRRMVNKPTRGLGDASIEKIVDLSAARGIDLLEALRLGAGESLLSGKAVSGAKLFADVFAHAGKKLQEEGNAACLELLITESQLLDHYKKQDDQNKTGKVENLGALISAVHDYPDGREGIAEFLESLMLDPTTIGRKDPSREPGVTLITMHNTKGLEFDRVFITGLEEGLFPGRASESDDDIEEERRIFYVAVTRARKDLHLLCCHRRMLWGRMSYQIPSRFLDEISKENLVIEGQRPGVSNDYPSVSGGYGYGGYGALDEKRMRSGSFASPHAGHRDAYGGFRNSNIVGVPVKPVASIAPGKTPGKNFNLGDHVYHDSYGEGEIQSVRTLRDRQLVDVIFQTGRKASFFSDAAPLEKLAAD